MDVQISEASSSSGQTRKKIYITDEPISPLPQQPFDYHSLEGQDPTICIDNGSHSWRAGFSTMSTPYIDRMNVISRYKERKAGRNTMLFGRDTEVDANARGNARSMFDGDLLVHGDILESALDYTFLTLGIDSSRIEQPIIMTERLANPLFTRSMTSELLFELYGAPSVTYGVDSLFAFSRQQHRDGMALNLGHNSTTVIPVVDGRGIFSRAKRIPWGGAQAAEVMLKLAQLKYPSFPTKVTLNQATFMYQETCYFSSNYDEELQTMNDPVRMGDQTVIVQFPFTQPEIVEKTEAELAAAADKRREQGKRLQEMQARQRAEKLAALTAELEEYKSLLLVKTSLSREAFLNRLAETTPFESEGELENWVKRNESDIRRKQKKAAANGDADAEADLVEDETPSFPLVDRPDSELTEEEIKEKRKQRLMKAGWEARLKLKEEKRKEKERQEEERLKEERFRETEPAAWSAKLRAEQDAVIERMQDRKKRRAQLGDRKSAAAQNRMKNIASLAAEEKVTKKRKTKGETDDGFGRDDSDWAVYREIGNDDESDAEEDDVALLQTLEDKLLQYDPTFTENDTLAGRAIAKNALVNAFVRGGAENHRFDPDSLQESYQLHLNVERIRVPEAFFQPGMFGVDSAGLGEVAGWLLNGYEEELRKRMMQCIFVTGGSSKLPNLLPRLRNTLTPLLPFRAPLKIVSSVDGADPRLEAWRGMAAWSATQAAKEARVTRQEYDEYGGEWVKEHAWGNVPP